MIHLPSLIDKISARPNRPLFEQTCVIPDNKNYNEFWKEIYYFLRAIEFKSPIVKDIEKFINKDFGFFGFRVHPVTHEPKYFHVGLSLDLKRDQKIYPIYPGVLEYSGYGAVNGYYVLLSHPGIVTEDGYTFHTMYCHLKKPLVKFNSYQKMLREISLGSHPTISINMETCLGIASTSGISRAEYPGIYLECSFRKFDETPIIIDPLRLYAVRAKKNTTADLIKIKEINALFKSSKKQ